MMFRSGLYQKPNLFQQKEPFILLTLKFSFKALVSHAAQGPTNSIYPINVCLKLRGRYQLLFLNSCCSSFLPASAQKRNKKLLLGLPINILAHYLRKLQSLFPIAIILSYLQNLFLRHMFSIMGFPSKGRVPFLLQIQATDG